MNEINPDIRFNSLSRDDILSLFLKVVNTVEPSHPYEDNVYPVKKKNIKYGYKQSNSSYYASCGPKSYNQNKIIFKCDINYFNNSEPERILAILTHEITHITVGSHSNVESGSHPPRFWREFGYNAHIILDEWENIKDLFGDISKEKYIGKIISNEVTKYNIDKRYSDEMTRKHEMAKWFKNTLIHNRD